MKFLMVSTVYVQRFSVAIYIYIYTARILQQFLEPLPLGHSNLIGKVCFVVILKKIIHYYINLRFVHYNNKYTITHN